MRYPFIALLLTSTYACNLDGDGAAKSAAPIAAKATIAPPSPTDSKPLDLPGVHNLVTYSPNLVSGSVPEGEEGFESLAAMGVRTVISVDGAVPEVELARKLGLRYVHLPIGYNGITDERALELAKAVNDLPGPIYVHCHHGKHRSASALATAIVKLGLATPEVAIERMKVSGTAKTYTGLYACVQNAVPVDSTTLANAPADFPEISKPTNFVQTMVEIDEIVDHLKASEKAGWTVPNDHPDMVPTAEAGRLVDHYRSIKEMPAAASKPPSFFELLEKARANAQAMEDTLVQGTTDTKALSDSLAKINADCKACHVAHRD